jgi:metal-sulfur cluster biosynthetic enzyme
MTLEELMVVSSPQVSIKQNIVDVEFTPTVPHCGASTLIGQQFLSALSDC